MRKICSVCILVFVTAASILFTSCNSSADASGQREVTSVYDYVLDVGTYASLDWDWAMSQEEVALNQMSCHCSAAVTQTSDGITLVGRNFDFYINHKPLFLFRTAVDGCYQTIGISTVLKKMYKAMPFSQMFDFLFG